MKVYNVQGAQILQWYLINNVLLVLDSNLSLSQLGLAKGEGHVPKVIWNKSISLLLFDQIKEFQNLGSLLRDAGLTDTTLAINGKVVSIETGRLLLEEAETKITLMPNMLLYKKNGQLIVKSNPGSRQLRTGDATLRKHVTQFH